MSFAAAWAKACMAAALGAPIVGCGARSPPSSVESPYREPRWQDVFDTTPEILAIVRPRALRQDNMYGALLRRAIEVVRLHSRVVAATCALEAFEDAEELIIGVHADSGRSAELVLVARGVRADLDPVTLVDADGRALWSPGPPGAVRELERESDERGAVVGASLFELPGRTWVVASGEARVRAREVFAHPTNRPPIEIDPDALGVLRLAGPPLVDHVRELQGTGDLAAVGRGLKVVVLTLPPGQDRSVRATLSYADEDTARPAEVAVRQALHVIARSQHEEYLWLNAAQVERPDRRVLVTAPLPQGVVDALVRAGAR